MSEWVPYHEPSIAKAKELVRGKVTEKGKYAAIIQFVDHDFVYDYIKAIKVAKKKGVMPDVERTWNVRMGICQDIAAMTVGMLRAVGIRAELCIGKNGRRNNHAWVEAIVDGKHCIYDHRMKTSNVYKAERRY
jgi:transglutaminase-like putative cysteine protease